jgi:organic radical activating enzyme
MNCPHCLRGPAQNATISKELIRKVLNQFNDIKCLTLTGGEPSLVPELIKYTVDYVVNHNIELGALYIVTNGKVYSQQMVNAMRKAYNYSYDPEMCALCVSVDEFHDKYDADAYMRYELEPFFRRDKEQSKLRNFLINEGNAYYNGIGKRNLNVRTEINSAYVNISDSVIDLEDDLIYVTTEGNVLLDCDVSYENESMYTIGNINDSTLEDIIMAHIV